MSCGTIQPVVTTDSSQRDRSTKGANDPVDDVAAELSAGIARRRAELAALADSARAGQTAEAQQLPELLEPVPVSPRPLLGRLIVFSRRLFYHLFLKWYARPLVEQLNEAQRATELRMELLQRRIDDLDRRLSAIERHDS